MTFNLAIAAIFKNENPYLLEWIEFHRLVGVEHFYLYDNDGGDSARALLAPYEAEGLVTRHNWTHLDGTRHDRPTHFGGRDKNHMAFGHAAKHHRTECAWLLKIDIDEFLLPREGSTIPPLLESFDPSRVKGIRIPRVDFGHSGHRERPKGLVIENYLERESRPSDYKELANARFLNDNRWMNSAHHWSYRLSSRAKRVNADEVNSMWVYHYYTKSLAESMQRQNMMRTRPTSVDQWEAQNAELNAVHDESMLRFGPEVERRLDCLARGERPAEVPKYSPSPRAFA